MDTRLLITAVIALLSSDLHAQEEDFLRDEVMAQMKWRSVGPVNFGGRVVDLAVSQDNPAIFYVATGSGGLFKTTNNGTSFTSIFDNEAVISIGDIAIAPTNPDLLWVGTGEANNQRSSYFGNGVYKSTDAGETWAHVGLDGTDHIGRIAAHPTDPKTVFVAALGSLYTANEERGLYRTTDGGESWERVAHVNDDVGFVDVAIDPANPDVIYAASYERRRRAHDFDESGPGSAIWKSTDGGDEWRKLAGGLPSGEIGRIGLALFAGDTDVLYATVENRNPMPPRKKPDGDPGEAGSDAGAKKEPGTSTASERRPIGGEVYRSDDGGGSWTKQNSRSIGGRPGYYYGQIRVDPVDDQLIYVMSVRMHVSRDGGETWKSGFDSGLHADQHAMWIDPANPRHILLGNDGGLAITWDRGANWDYQNNLPIAQYYAIGVDQRDPYWIYGGTQDNGTWGVPSRGATSRGIEKMSAVKISGGDGFYVCVDPTDPNVVYSESQFGRVMRQNLATGDRKSIQPRAQRGSPRLRFNWMSPIVISPHNPFTVYFGSQHVHRSRDRGDTWQTISPDLTTADPEKLKGDVPHCTVTTIAESPLQPDLLWAGTDDGKVWKSVNGGARWTDLTDRFEGMPMPLWVSRVEASSVDADVAYVSFTGYREDLREPYLYLTEDGGETFRSIANNLPKASINVVREHPRNPDVLFVGTELDVQVSVDAGANWRRLGSGLPTIPVHDLLVHPREDDLVIGTHGRGIYVLDITALGQLNQDILTSDFHVFPPRDGRVLPSGFGRGYTGERRWAGENPELGASFWYYLAEDQDGTVSVTVEDSTGRRVHRRSGSGSAGLHVVVWRPRGQGTRGGGPQSRRASGPGQFVVRVRMGEQEVSHPFWIHASPGMGQLFFSEDSETPADQRRGEL